MPSIAPGVVMVLGLGVAPAPPATAFAGSLIDCCVTLEISILGNCFNRPAFILLKVSGEALINLDRYESFKVRDYGPDNYNSDS